MADCGIGFSLAFDHKQPELPECHPLVNELSFFCCLRRIGARGYSQRGLGRKRLEVSESKLHHHAFGARPSHHSRIYNCVPNPRHQLGIGPTYIKEDMNLGRVER